jgi:hypothetical protein
MKIQHVFFSSFFLILALQSSAGLAQRNPVRPNIVLIFADDLGWKVEVVQVRRCAASGTEESGLFAGDAPMIE